MGNSKSMQHHPWSKILARSLTRTYTWSPFFFFFFSIVKAHLCPMCLLQCGGGTKSQATSFWACISSSVASAALAWDRLTLILDFSGLLPLNHEVHVLMPRDLKMWLWYFLNCLTVLPLSRNIMTSWYHGFPLTLVKHSPTRPSFFLFINSEGNLSFSLMTNLFLEKKFYIS